MKPVHVAIVGAGSRGLYNLATRIAESAAETGLRVTALCDRRQERLDEACEYLGAAFREHGVDCRPRGTTDWNEVAADPAIDAVMVTTPQCFHREPAVAALRAGKRVYVDKPLAHTLEDARAILEEQTRTGHPVMVGFTRRYEAPWQRARELLRSGAIGDLHMAILRDIIPFHTFFHRWHRRRQWSGGALNDKSSHHCDVLNWFAESRALRISAMGGRRVFRTREDAPARCLDCPDRECPYRIGPTRGRRLSQEEMEIKGNAWLHAESEFERADTCVYLPGADIKDHAVIQVAYENGVVGSLIVSFFGPKAEDQETMELVGTRGTILLNRHTGSLRLITDHGRTLKTEDCRSADFQGSHFGADAELVRRFRRFCDGEPPVVSAIEGYEATRMIMAVHDAIDAGGATIDLTSREPGEP
ncbi:MAG: Gfo/Idh/MocA family oxidoreductase [Lentisphaeria bacterium]|nr:Gfo/Idh/MocA family oxidoreductase [Lentisphaeria bacterium]